MPDQAVGGAEPCIRLVTPSRSPNMVHLHPSGIALQEPNPLPFFFSLGECTDVPSNFDEQDREIHA
jgi:hypothetical protein